MALGSKITGKKPSISATAKKRLAKLRGESKDADQAAPQEFKTSTKGEKKKMLVPKIPGNKHKFSRDDATEMRGLRDEGSDKDRV